MQPANAALQIIQDVRSYQITGGLAIGLASKEPRHRVDVAISFSSFRTSTLCKLWDTTISLRCSSLRNDAPLASS